MNSPKGDIQLFRYQLGLSTLLTFAGQALSSRNGVLLKFIDGDKVVWSDCAPLPGFSHDTLTQNESALRQWYCGDIESSALPNAARFAVDMGYWLLQNEQPVKLPPTVPLLVGSAEQQLSQLEQLSDEPKAIKLKVGRYQVERDIELINQVVAASPNLRLRLDANRLWDFDAAATFARSIPLDAIDYVEEPCAKLEESLKLYEQYGLPLALDETTQAEDYQYDLYPGAQAGIRALVLKPTVLGGLDRLKALIKQAHDDGIQVVLSSSFESNVGLENLAALAQTFTPDATPGLDTLRPLAADLIRPNLWGMDKPIIEESQLEPL